MICYTFQTKFVQIILKDKNMEISFIIKKIVILFTLVDPIGALPLFLAACAQADIAKRTKFAFQLSMTIFIALLISAIAGSQLLKFFGVSLGSMQVGGGLIALLFSIGMIQGQEKDMKQTDGEKKAATDKMQLVPLAIPLMAGPAALSFVMSNSNMNSFSSIFEIIFSITLVAGLSFLVLQIGNKIQNHIRPEFLTLIEKLFGFLLTMLAVEMIVAGVKSLFNLS